MGKCHTWRPKAPPSTKQLSAGQKQQAFTSPAAASVGWGGSMGWKVSPSVCPEMPGKSSLFFQKKRTFSKLNHIARTCLTRDVTEKLGKSHLFSWSKHVTAQHKGPRAGVDANLKFEVAQISKMWCRPKSMLETFHIPSYGPGGPDFGVWTCFNMKCIHNEAVNKLLKPPRRTTAKSPDECPLGSSPWFPPSADLLAKRVSPVASCKASHRTGS